MANRRSRGARSLDISLRSKNTWRVRNWQRTMCQEVVVKRGVIASQTSEVEQFQVIIRLRIWLWESLEDTEQWWSQWRWTSTGIEGPEPKGLSAWWLELPRLTARCKMEKKTISSVLTSSKNEGDFQEDGQGQPCWEGGWGPGSMDFNMAVALKEVNGKRAI